MRRTLIVTRGLPAAGKTTRALGWVAEDPERRARVGSDEIAEMLHPQVIGGDAAAYGPHYAMREQLVVNAAIEVLLRSGVDVVCDDPFLVSHYLDIVREVAERCSADLVVWDMTDVDVEECIARDRQRGRAGGQSVGEHAIRAQYRLLRAHQPPRIAAPNPGQEVVACAGSTVADPSAHFQPPSALVARATVIYDSACAPIGTQFNKCEGLNP